MSGSTALRRSTRRAGVLVVAVVSLGLGIAQPSGASEISTAGRTAAPGEFPPTCVNVIDDPDKRQVITENLCQYDTSVKIIIAFGPDSECQAVPPKRSAFFFYKIGGRYDRAEVCA